MTEVEQQQPISEELSAAIRKEVVQKVASYTVLATIALLGIAGAGWLLYLQDRVPDWVHGVPKGAVVAFDVTDGCPNGWSSFDDASGRFVLGSGTGKNLTDRPLRTIGGSEEHKLALGELPAMEFDISNLAGASSVDKYSAGGKDYPVVRITSGHIKIGGQDTPFSILPPYIALHFCKRI